MILDTPQIGDHATAIARFWRPCDTLAERPIAGAGALARCPQTGGYTTNESARPCDTLPERPIAGAGAWRTSADGCYHAQPGPRPTAVSRSTKLTSSRITILVRM